MSADPSPRWRKANDVRTELGAAIAVADVVDIVQAYFALAVWVLEPAPCPLERLRVAKKQVRSLWRYEPVRMCDSPFVEQTYYKDKSLFTWEFTHSWKCNYYDGWSLRNEMCECGPVLAVSVSEFDALDLPLAVQEKWPLASDSPVLVNLFKDTRGAPEGNFWEFCRASISADLDTRGRLGELGFTLVRDADPPPNVVGFATNRRGDVMLYWLVYVPEANEPSWLDRELEPIFLDRTSSEQPPSPRLLWIQLDACSFGGTTPGACSPSNPIV